MRTRGNSFGGFIPFFSAYGLFNGLHTCLCGGQEIRMVPVFDPSKFADMLLDLKPNSFLGVPRFHEQLLDHPKLQGTSNRLAWIKNPVSGGDKIAPATIAKINDLYRRNGAKVGLRVGYGSSELGGSISVMPTYDLDGQEAAFPWQQEGNVGYLLASCRAMVINPDTGEELPIGEEGELCVSSLCQMEGYFGLPEVTKEIEHFGPDGTKYYRMGDKGYLTDLGCFIFTGRYKRSMMRPDGHTVRPVTIDTVIM